MFQDGMLEPRPQVRDSSQVKYLEHIDLLERITVNNIVLSRIQAPAKLKARLNNEQINVNMT
jgi:hypothetical protein